MAYEWGRFIWWLYHDPNAPGVVQAFTAIVTAILTGTLIFFTWRYNRLTRQNVEIAARMATTAAKQLASGYQPELAIDFTEMAFVTGSLVGTTRNAMLGLLVILRNTGEHPIKIRELMAGVIGITTPVQLGGVLVPSGLVLMPDKEFRTRLTLDTGLPSVDTKRVSAMVVVHCSDLAEVSEHRFVYSESDGLRHSLGFK